VAQSSETAVDKEGKRQDDGVLIATIISVNDLTAEGVTMAVTAKIAALARIAVKDPYEAFYRIRAFTASFLQKSSPEAEPFAYLESEFSDFCEILDRTFNTGTSDLLTEPQLLSVREHVQKRLDQAERNSPMATALNGGEGLCNICYLACRALQPVAVVETGVAHGITSAYVLAALESNGRGHLYSIDRPPLALGSDEFVGICIPDTLRQRHTLIRGDARAKLPALLNSLGGIDMFIHDSDHSYGHMKFELRLALQHLRVPGVVVSDDVNLNAAFHEFVGDSGPSASVVMKRGDAEGGCSGISVFT
jgi:predicted O-methyltransferase YrrM